MNRFLRKKGLLHGGVFSQDAEEDWDGVVIGVCVSESGEESDDEVGRVLVLSINKNEWSKTTPFIV
jgi:hypothetical protein